MQIYSLQSTGHPIKTTKQRQIQRALKKHGGIMEEKITGFLGEHMTKQVRFHDGTYGTILTDPDSCFILLESREDEMPEPQSDQPV